MANPPLLAASKYLQRAFASGEVLDMGMEWWCSPIQDWNELQRLLDEHPRNVKMWREAATVWSKCDIDPDPEFAPDTFYARGIGDLVDRAKGVANRCPDTLREHWQRLFFAPLATPTRWASYDYSADYLTSARELRVLEVLRDSHPLSRLCAALSPATVARLAQWSRELPLDDYESYFRLVDEKSSTECVRLNRYANDWNSYAAYTEFWFEILQKADACGCGLLTFVA